MSALTTIRAALQPFLATAADTPFHYERNLLVDQAPHLDAFVRGVPFPPFEVEIQMSSRCNLQCQWCVGKAIQDQNQVRNLPNWIDPHNVDRIVDGILAYHRQGLGIETVKFSGFIGEPLVPKAATLRAIQRLVGAGLRVGLFTNGLLMEEDTWNTLANVDYVHVSLDAGPTSFYWLKEAPKRAYSTASFEKVLANIRGLHATRTRRTNRARVRINVGFVVVPGNQDEIHTTAQQVRDAGADSLRFKCDIVGKHPVNLPERLDCLVEQIERVRKALHDPPCFVVSAIHQRADIERRTYAAWRCDRGCHFQHFLGTVGSDGNLYLCDHNTLPGAVPLGNVINQPFAQVWESARRTYLAEGVRHTCQASVCPPFGNRANAFLERIATLRDRYGADLVGRALQKLRARYEKPANPAGVEGDRVAA